ncbi:MAG: DUF1667 domain-containing protein [Clostridia bacterium]|nr:DUF1667 domain-containing protein [Clostridia bacterium]
MTERNLICIACPRGCAIKVTLDDNKEVVNIEGATCKNGEEYARNEVTHPMRNLTSTIKVTGGIANVAPVRTNGDIPKELLFDAMKVINQASVAAPVHVGDVVIPNILDTGIDVIATNEIA